MSRSPAIALSRAPTVFYRAFDPHSGNSFTITPDEPSNPPGSSTLHSTTTGVTPASADDAAPPLPKIPQHKSGPASFDSGLDDCDISFDDLKKKSSACTSAVTPNGTRCEAYSVSQFTEIVRIKLRTPGGEIKTQCTGTLLSADWVLTAAHCIIAAAPASNYAATQGADIVWTNDELKAKQRDFIISADNVVSLSGDESSQTPSLAIINGGYTGYGPGNGENDLALIRLSYPLPASAIEPAQLATPEETNELSTVAGFGITNVQVPLGTFLITWPQKLTISHNEMTFPTNDSDHSGFCNGDSGGPLLAGRYRGCRSSDTAGERRPRLLQGVISYYVNEPSDRDLPASQRCMRATRMTAQNVVDAPRRNWICQSTGGQAGGCSNAGPTKTVP